MAEFIKINITLPGDLLARVNARAGVIGRSTGKRSMTIAADLRTLYDLTDRAERTVRNILTPEQIEQCRAALQGTFIEPSLIPHLASEIEEALEGTDPLLVGKLRQCGLMELYALGEMIQRERDNAE